MQEGRIQRKPKSGGRWRLFWGFLRKVKLSWVWIAVALAGYMGYNRVVTLLPGSTAALYAGDFSMEAIMGLVVNSLGVMVLDVGTTVAMLVANAWSVYHAHNSVWKRMMRVDTSYFGDNDPSRLLSSVTSDVETSVNTLVNVIITAPSQLAYLLMCLEQVSSYNKKLLMVLLVMVPLYVVYAVIMGRWQEKTGRIIQVRIGFLTERIRNLTLIKSFVTEQKEEEKGTAAAGELYKVNVQYGCLQGVLTGFTQLTEAISVVIAVIWGSVLLRSGEVDLESWLAFFLFVPRVNSALRNLAAMWGGFKAVQGRTARISAMVDAPQEHPCRRCGVPECLLWLCRGRGDPGGINTQRRDREKYDPNDRNDPPNSGTPALDTTCYPADIAYPQDINLLKRIF